MRAHVFLIEGDPSNTKEATQTKKRLLPNCKDNANSRNAESPPTKITKNKHPIPILQVQLASAKLAICLKNSVFGFEKLSFFLGLRLSFFATFLMY